MHFALDHLAALAADEFLLDDTDLLLAEADGTDIEDICWESVQAPNAAYRWRPREAA